MPRRVLVVLGFLSGYAVGVVPAPWWVTLVVSFVVGVLLIMADQAESNHASGA
jgi:hypothetical protein